MICAGKEESRMVVATIAFYVCLTIARCRRYVEHCKISGLLHLYLLKAHFNRLSRWYYMTPPNQTSVLEDDDILQVTVEVGDDMVDLTLLTKHVVRCMTLRAIDEEVGRMLVDIAQVPVVDKTRLSVVQLQDGNVLDTSIVI